MKNEQETYTKLEILRLKEHMTEELEVAISRTKKAVIQEAEL